MTSNHFEKHNLKNLDLEDRARLVKKVYSIHIELFGGMDEDSFIQFLLDKRAISSIIYLLKKDNEYIGYIYQGIVIINIDKKKKYIGLSTVAVLPEARPPKIFLFIMLGFIKYKLAHPFRFLYVIETIVNSKLYSNLLNFTYFGYPRHNKSTPSYIQSLIYSFAEMFHWKLIKSHGELVKINEPSFIRYPHIVKNPDKHMLYFDKVTNHDAAYLVMILCIPVTYLNIAYVFSKILFNKIIYLNKQ